MSLVFPKGTVLTVKAGDALHAINITLLENVHFEPEHNETPEQATNQLALSGLMPLVKAPPVVVPHEEADAKKPAPEVPAVKLTKQAFIEQQIKEGFSEQQAVEQWKNRDK